MTYNKQRQLKVRDITYKEKEDSSKLETVPRVKQRQLMVRDVAYKKVIGNT
jgi:hypothetical protein